MRNDNMSMEFYFDSNLVIRFKCGNVIWELKRHSLMLIHQRIISILNDSFDSDVLILYGNLDIELGNIQGL